MSTIVYLGNKMVQIVEGTSGTKLTVTKNLTLRAPEGTIINGIVMDQEAFTEFIKSAFAKHSVSSKEVTLVINTSKFVGQTLELPRMSDKSVLGYIRREFADIDKDSDRVYGFIRMGDGDKGLTRIYSESVSPDYLKEYVDLFGSMGIKLKGIYSAQTNLINLIAKTTAKSYDNFLLLIAGSMTLTTVIFSDKKFIYYNSSRCFHEPGTEEYAADMAKSVSQIGQFMKANQIEHGAEHIFLAGINRDDLPMYKEAIGQVDKTTPVKVFEFGSLGTMSDRDAQHFLFSLGGLFNTDSCSDYLRQMKNRKSDKKDGIRWKYIMPIAITAVIMSLALFGSLMFATTTEMELSQLKNDNAHSQNKLMYEDELQKNVNLISDYLNVGNVNENLATYPVPGTKVIQVVKKHADNISLVILNYTFQTGKLEVKITANSADAISEYISALKKEDEVEDIVYTGYSYVEGTHSYTSNIEILLAESAGRE